MTKPWLDQALMESVYKCELGNTCAGLLNCIPPVQIWFTDSNPYWILNFEFGVWKENEFLTQNRIFSSAT